MTMNRIKLTIFTLGCSLATALAQNTVAPAPIPVFHDARDR
jgi:hypothetical protein